MDRRRALHMRRDGFEEVPFRRFHPNRIGRSVELQVAERFGRAKKTDGDDIGRSLRPDVFIEKCRGSGPVGLSNVRKCPRTSQERLPSRVR